MLRASPLVSVAVGYLLFGITVLVLPGVMDKGWVFAIATIVGLLVVTVSTSLAVAAIFGRRRIVEAILALLLVVPIVWFLARALAALS